jgi:hypothetical protein
LVKNFDAARSMCVDAVGVSGGGIFEIAGEADRRRKFVARLRVEIGVTDAAVDGAMAETQVGKIARMEEADRDVARYIGHVIVDAGIPAHRELWNHIAEAIGRLTESDRPGEEDRSDRSGDRSIQCGAVLSVGGKQADGRLAAEEWRCEHVGWREKADVSPGVGTETYLKKMLAVPIPAFTFSATGASVYQLGGFGTARKELKALTLSP